MSPPAIAQLESGREFSGNLPGDPSLPAPLWVVTEPSSVKPLPVQNEAELRSRVPSAASNVMFEAPRAVLLSKYKVELPPARFEVRQQWEGTVLEVGDAEFIASLLDRTDRMQAEEQATFSLDEVPDEDREFVVAGGVFYWSIGYELSRGGQKRSVSEIRFRRLPAWTKGELEAVRRETEELLKTFGSSTSEAAGPAR